MKKFTFTGCLALVLLVLNIGVAHAQTLITGDIVGRVVDKSGAVVAGATLTLTSDADGSKQTVKSGTNGNYRFPLLRPGSYSIHEEGSGMSANLKNISVNVGQATAVEIVVGATGNNVLGANELQEAAVVVNGYTGQYGRLAGAQVNFTTISGTNQFHGNANFYYNSSGFNANDWFNKSSQLAGGLQNTQPHAVSRQWSGRIGGPIWKNKLFAFFDDEGLRYVLPSGGSTIYLPSTAFQNAVLANVAANQPSELAYYKNIFALYSGANGFKTATPSTNSDSSYGCGDFAGTTVGGVTFGGGPSTACSVAYSPANNNLNTEQLYSVRIDAHLTAQDQLNARLN